MTTARSTTDAVAVYTQGYTQVFPRARILKATIDEPSKTMEHPLETGAIITDHRIILPIRIELVMILQSADYLNAYRQMKQLFLNATLLSVQTKATVYTNQLIAELPHEEDPDKFDALSVLLKFKQVLFATSIFSISPQNPQNSSTTNRGQQQTSFAGPSSQLNGKLV